MDKLTVTSVFNNGGKIPIKYTCDGDDINPPLTIKGIPKNTETMVLIIDDPDAPSGTFDHWVVFNIPPKERIEEDSVPGIQGLNSWKRDDYGGPCPPQGTHRYYFRAFALDTTLNLTAQATKSDVISKMKNHVLAQGELMGVYSR